MLNAPAQLRQNIRLLYTATFLENSFYIDAIYVLFGTQYLHLSYLRAGSLLFAGWFASIVFDFAGGVLADRIGRKPTQLYGLALQFGGFVPYLFTTNYAVLLAGGLVYGVGMACTSNTIQALVYEQAAEQGGSKMYQRFNALSQVWVFAGLASAALVGGVAYVLDPRLPYLLLLIGFAGAFVACARINVPKTVERKITAEQKQTKGIVRTALHTFRDNRQLLFFVIVSFCFGVSGDLLFSYYQPFYVTFHLSAAGFGLLYLVLRSVSALGSYGMQHAPNRLSLPVIQLASVASVGISAALMLVVGYPAVLLAPVVAAVGFGTIYPTLRLFINTHAANKARTATLSFGTGVMNLGVSIGFIGAFWAADRYSADAMLGTVLVVTAVTLVVRVVTLENFLHKFKRSGSVRGGGTDTITT
jgi:MFS family permease